MKHRTGLLAMPAFVVAAVALAATPALAATTFTVSPGGAWSGTRAADSTVGIRDAVSNQVTLCSGLAVTGSFKPGKGLSGTNIRSEEHTSELQSLRHLVCRLLLEKKNNK